MVDRVVTTGTVFLGLTMECTRCHDHKYDPLTMRDFYSMFAFFNSIDGPAMDGNVKDTKPTVLAPSKEQAEQLAQLHARRQRLGAEKEKIRGEKEADFQTWIEQQHALTTDPKFLPPAPPSNGLRAYYPLELQADKTILDAVAPKQPGHPRGPVESISGRYGKACKLTKQGHLDLGNRFGFQHDQSFSLALWVQLPGPMSGTILSKAQPNRRGYALATENGHVTLELISRADGYGIRVATGSRPLALEGWHHIVATYDGSGKAAGIVIYIDGHRQPLKVKLDSLVSKGDTHSINSDDAHLLVGRRSGKAEALLDGQVDELRIYNRRLSSTEVIDVMLADGIDRLLVQGDRPLHNGTNGGITHLLFQSL